MIDVKNIEKIERPTIISVYGLAKYEKWTNNYIIQLKKEKFPILKDKKVIFWLEQKILMYSVKGKNADNFKLDQYILQLTEYCNYYQMKPSELLDEELEERNKKLSMYLLYLQNNGGKRSSIYNCIQSRIKGFFSTCNRDITFQIKCVSSGDNDYELTIDKDIIKRIMGQMNSPQYRLLIKFQSQLGFRIDDLLIELTSGKYHIEKHKNHYYIPNFITQKELIKINFMFLPTELTKQIQDFYAIDDLTKFDLTQLFMNRIEEKEKDHDDKKHHKWNAHRIDKANYLNRVQDIWYELNGYNREEIRQKWRNKLSDKKELAKAISEEMEEIDCKIRIPKTHSFRKFFTTTIGQISSLDLQFKEHLTGHALTNLADSYNRKLQDKEWYYQNWLIIEPLISIDTEFVDKTDEKVKELTDKNSILEKEVEMLKDKFKELQDKFLQMVSVKFIEVNGKKMTIEELTK